MFHLLNLGGGEIRILKWVEGLIQAKVLSLLHVVVLHVFGCAVNQACRAGICVYRFVLMTRKVYNFALIWYFSVKFMYKVLHLSHTDIESDSRILKSLRAAKDNGFWVRGVGIKNLDVGQAVNRGLIDDLGVISIDLFWRRFKWVPNAIRYPLVVLEFYFKLLFIIRGEKPDLIHCNDVIPLPIAVLSGFFKKTKIIYDAHELESEKNGLSGIMKIVVFNVERFFWGRIDGLIVVSPSIKAWYQEKFKKIPTQIIMNSPEISEFKGAPNNKYFHEKYELNEGDIVFLYIGGFMRGRGLDLVADVIGGVEGCHVVYLGYGPEKNRLIEFSKKYKNIHVHDAVAHHEVVSFAKSADIGLCLIEKISLSDYYCLPNKLFEYSFSGLPVLATNFPDINSIISKYKNGVCVNLDVASIKAGVQVLLDGYDGFKSNYRDIDFKELGWAAQADKIIAIYNDVLLV